MPRPVTARPAGEHLTTLTRMMRQLSVDGDMDPRRRAAILEAIDKASGLLRKELTEPPKRRKR